jgi:hypothetical protein
MFANPLVISDAYYLWLTLNLNKENFEKFFFMDKKI